MNTEFETILDICIDRIQSGESLDTVLAKYPEYASELRPLLQTSVALENLPRQEPSPEKINSALYEIGRREGIRVRKTGWNIPGSIFQKTWVQAAVSVILVVISLFWGMSTVSADSVPGQVWYPFKLFTEKVQFILTFGQEKRAELRLTFSEERLEELSELFQKTGKVDTQLIQAMLAEAGLVLERYTSDDRVSPYLVTKARHVSETQQDFLTWIQPHADQETQPVVDEAIRTCGRRSQQMHQRMNRMMEQMPMHQNMRNNMRDMMPHRGNGNGRR